MTQRMIPGESVLPFLLHLGPTGCFVFLSLPGLSISVWGKQNHDDKCRPTFLFSLFLDNLAHFSHSSTILAYPSQAKLFFARPGIFPRRCFDHNPPFVRRNGPNQSFGYMNAIILLSLPMYCGTHWSHRRPYSVPRVSVLLGMETLLPLIFTLSITCNRPARSRSVVC